MMASCICKLSSSSSSMGSFDENRVCIPCNNCPRIIHLECTNLQPHHIDEIAVFYCQLCRSYTGPPIMKTPTNIHRNNRYEKDAHDHPLQIGTPEFIRYLMVDIDVMEAKPGRDIKTMRGQQLTFKELVIAGFDKPILIKSIDGLEMTIDRSMSFQAIKENFPNDYLVDAIEVTRQIKVRIKLALLMTQFEIPSKDRQDIYAFRLNFSKLKNPSVNFTPPRIVQKLSWVDQYYPNVPFKPLLSKYCFASMMNAYQDFHIDLGGSSAWFHVFHGEQVFYLIEPSQSNLVKYEKWLKSNSFNENLSLYKIENIFKVRLTTEETIFIPNGWIYSVWTVKDTLSLGGYFLHSLSIAKQLSINQFLREKLQNINSRTINNGLELVDFPSYELTNWYAAPNILKLAKDSLKNQPPRHLSEGIEALIEKLREWLNRSKSKRQSSTTTNVQQEQQQIPKAINCPKIIRDLNHCLRNTKKTMPNHQANLNKDKSNNNKPLLNKSASSVPTQQQTPSASLPLISEETKIKDLVEDTADQDQSNLKIKLNMKKAQDVIRRSIDEQQSASSSLHDQTQQNNGRKFFKKKNHHEPFGKLMNLDLNQQTQQSNKPMKKEDDCYIYLDLETPNESQRAQKRSNDNEWEPGGGGGGSSNNSAQKKLKKTFPKATKKVLKEKKSSNLVSVGGDIDGQNSVSGSNQPIDSGGGQIERQQSTSSNTNKIIKPKKGLATPKQRLAKKLKLSR